jgi:predicted nuclease of restriction endonuclease-like (RecB) superfamily
MGRQKKNSDKIELKNQSDLFGRVADIIEASRAKIVRSVNHTMLVAYWHVGREIVEEVQKGDPRAAYGKQIIEDLSVRLTQRFGAGFSAQSLWNFRQFYQVYADRGSEIPSPTGRDLSRSEILSPTGREFEDKGGGQALAGTKKLGAGFARNLSWSHYRALMRVKNAAARAFYENEASECGWSKDQLERQIHSAYYERILKNSGETGLSSQGRERLPGETQSPVSMLKYPYVLEFLDLPDSASLHEQRLESAIISHLQAFLLELGKGFAFVARQKRMRYEDTDLYVDLVFYNCIIKCYLLIDLKIGELSHKDVGQMDSYVRMFDDLFTATDDNPTVGLILCTEKNETVAKYSVLSDRKNIFASKYMLYLPTEQELAEELQKERRLIEDRIAEKGLPWGSASSEPKE